MDGKLPWSEHGSSSSRDCRSSRELQGSHNLLGKGSGEPVTSLSYCTSDAFNTLLPDYHGTSSAMMMNPLKYSYPTGNQCLIEPGSRSGGNVAGVGSDIPKISLGGASSSDSQIPVPRQIDYAAQRMDQELDKKNSYWSSVINDSLEMSNGDEIAPTLPGNACHPLPVFHPAHSGGEITPIDGYHPKAQSEINDEQGVMAEDGEYNSFRTIEKSNVPYSGAPVGKDIGVTAMKEHDFELMPGFSKSLLGPVSSSECFVKSETFKDMSLVMHSQEQTLEESKQGCKMLNRNDCARKFDDGKIGAKTKKKLSFLNSFQDENGSATTFSNSSWLCPEDKPNIHTMEGVSKTCVIKENTACLPNSQNLGKKLKGEDESDILKSEKSSQEIISLPLENAEPAQHASSTTDGPFKLTLRKVTPKKKRGRGKKAQYEPYLESSQNLSTYAVDILNSSETQSQEANQVFSMPDQESRMKDKDPPLSKRRTLQEKSDVKLVTKTVLEPNYGSFEDPLEKGRSEDVISLEAASRNSRKLVKTSSNLTKEGLTQSPLSLQDDSGVLLQIKKDILKKECACLAAVQDVVSSLGVSIVEKSRKSPEKGKKVVQINQIISAQSEGDFKNNHNVTPKKQVKSKTEMQAFSPKKLQTSNDLKILDSSSAVKSEFSSILSSEKNLKQSKKTTETPNMKTNKGNIITKKQVATKDDGKPALLEIEHLATLRKNKANVPNSIQGFEDVTCKNQKLISVKHLQLEKMSKHSNSMPAASSQSTNRKKRGRRKVFETVNELAVPEREDISVAPFVNSSELLEAGSSIHHLEVTFENQECGTNVNANNQKARGKKRMTVDLVNIQTNGLEDAAEHKPQRKRGRPPLNMNNYSSTVCSSEFKESLFSSVQSSILEHADREDISDVSLVKTDVDSSDLLEADNNIDHVEVDSKIEECATTLKTKNQQVRQKKRMNVCLVNILTTDREGHVNDEQPPLQKKRRQSPSSHISPSVFEESLGNSTQSTVSELAGRENISDVSLVKHYVDSSNLLEADDSVQHSKVESRTQGCAGPHKVKCQRRKGKKRKVYLINLPNTDCVVQRNSEQQPQKKGRGRPSLKASKDSSTVSPTGLEKSFCNFIQSEVMELPDKDCITDVSLVKNCADSSKLQETGGGNHHLEKESKRQECASNLTINNKNKGKKRKTTSWMKRIKRKENAAEGFRTDITACETRLERPFSCSLQTTNCEGQSNTEPKPQRNRGRPVFKINKVSSNISPQLLEESLCRFMQNKDLELSDREDVSNKPIVKDQENPSKVLQAEADGSNHFLEVKSKTQECAETLKVQSRKGTRRKIVSLVNLKTTDCENQCRKRRGRPPLTMSKVTSDITLTSIEEPFSSSMQSDIYEDENRDKLTPQKRRPALKKSKTTSNMAETLTGLKMFLTAKVKEENKAAISSSCDVSNENTVATSMQAVDAEVEQKTPKRGRPFSKKTKLRLKRALIVANKCSPVVISELSSCLNISESTPTEVKHEDEKRMEVDDDKNQRSNEAEELQSADAISTQSHSSPTPKHKTSRDVMLTISTKASETPVKDFAKDDEPSLSQDFKDIFKKDKELLSVPGAIEEPKFSKDSIQVGGDVDDFTMANKAIKLVKRRKSVQKTSTKKRLVVAKNNTTVVFKTNKCSVGDPESSVKESNQVSEKPLTESTTINDGANAMIKVRISTARHQKKMKKPLGCKYCGLSFRHLTAFTIHRRIHTGAKPFQCKVCGKAFAQLSQLKSHRNVHKQSISLPCPCCSEQFLKKEDLLHHFKVHLMESKPEERQKNAKQKQTNVKMKEKLSNASLFESNFNRDRRMKFVARHHRESLSCKNCGKMFMTSSSLTAHERTHWPVKPYACSICGKGFNLLKILKKHSEGHSGELPFSCFHCGHAFSELAGLRLHQSSKSCLAKKNTDARNNIEGLIVNQGVDGQVNTPVFFKCQICKQQFRKWCQYNLHLQTHNNCPSYICFSCGQCYEKESESIHCNVCCQSSGEDKICGGSLSEIMQRVIETNLSNLSSSQSLQSLVKQQHPQKQFSSELLSNPVPEKPSKTISTQTCGLLTSASTTTEHNTSPEHIKNPSVWNFSCMRCGQRFKQYRSLSLHLQRHQPSFKYLCRHCGQVFERWSKLWLHQRHHRFKSNCYPCDECSLQFRFFGSFKQHMIDHARQKPDVCSLASNTFSLEDHAHQQESNTFRKSFECDVCAKSFSSLKNLIMHSLLHNGATSHICLPCNLSFTNSTALKEHLKTHTTNPKQVLPDIPLKPLHFTHECKRCKARFSNGDLLYAHQICHSRDTIALVRPAIVPTSNSDSCTESTFTPAATHQIVSSNIKLNSIPDDDSVYIYPHPDHLYVSSNDKEPRPIINLDEQDVSESQKNHPEVPKNFNPNPDSTVVHQTASHQRTIDLTGSKAIETAEKAEEDLISEQQIKSTCDKSVETDMDFQLELAERFECADCCEKLNSVRNLYEHYILHALGDNYLTN